MVDTAATPEVEEATPEEVTPEEEDSLEGVDTTMPDWKDLEPSSGVPEAEARTSWLFCEIIFWEIFFQCFFAVDYEFSDMSCWIQVIGYTHMA